MTNPSVTDVFIAINNYLCEEGIDVEGPEVKLWSLLGSPQVADNAEHKAFFRARIQELANAGWFAQKVQAPPEVVIPALQAVGATIPECLRAHAVE